MIFKKVLRELRKTFIPICVQFYCSQTNKTITKVLCYMLTKVNVNNNVKILGTLADHKLVTNESYKSIFNEIDVEWCKSTGKLNLDEVLFLLNAWSVKQHEILPNSIFYNIFLERLDNSYLNYASWDQLVQITHYVSYLKGKLNSKLLMIKCLHKISESIDLQNANYKDISIIAEASYKTTTVIVQDNIINKMNKIIEENKTELLHEPEWFVMLIKALRLARKFDLKLLTMIGDEIINNTNTTKYPFTTLSYILSIFADSLIKNEILLDKIVESSINCFENVSWKTQNHKTHFSYGLRVKDVNTFLWALSVFQYPLSDHHSKTIEEFILWKYENGALSSYPEMLVQCLVSLWMLGITSSSLFEKIVTMKTLHKLKGKEKNQRDLSRFSLLINLYKSENENLNESQLQVQEKLNDMKLIVPAIKKEVSKRSSLVLMKKLLENVEATECMFEYVVPRLYVLGCSANVNGTQTHLDLLDKTLCYHGTQTPAGLLTSKIRLMKKLVPGICHILVSEDLVTTNNTESKIQFFQFIKKSIEEFKGEKQ